MQWPYLVMPVVYFLKNDEHSVHSAHSPPKKNTYPCSTCFNLNTTARTSIATAQPRHVTFCNNMPARRKRKAVDLAVCISRKKKKASGKAAAQEQGKNVVKHCIKNRMNWAKWGTKGSKKTHRMTPVSEIMDDDHLKKLKDDVRPLLKGESVMRLL
jgi:hypothetical protein